tara:strand:- start:171 stop:410 length:240 start_codon:yes stop_codon:yes gene_type:complete
MKVAISGFGKDEKMYNFLKTQGFTISDVVSDDTSCVLIRESLDYIQFKSAKIKHAIMKNVPILSLEDINNTTKELKKLK